MSDAARYDFPLQRGNTRTILFRCKVGEALFDWTGITAIFRVLHRGKQIIRKEALIPTPANGEAMIPITLEDSRLIPLGKIADYELEARAGVDQETILYGKITGTGGVNDDV